MKLYKEYIIQLNEGRIMDSYKCTNVCEKQIQTWKTTIPAAILTGSIGLLIAVFYSKRGLLSQLCNARCYMLAAEKALKEDPDKTEKNKKRVRKAKQYFKERNNRILERAAKLKKLKKMDALLFLNNHYKNIHRIKIK